MKDDQGEEADDDVANAGDAAASEEIPPPPQTGRRHHARDVTRSFAQRIVYDALRTMVRILATGLFQFRIFGREREPEQGPVVVCCNHQSSLDPGFVGAALSRRLSFLARKELFQVRWKRRFVEFFDAIELDRHGFSREGLARAIDRLKHGRAVLIFPEGSRTPDGTVQPLRTGVLLLARRSRATLLPVGLSGAYEMWPKGRSFPWPTVVHLVVGEPFAYEEYRELDADETLAELERRMKAAFDQAAASRREALGLPDSRSDAR